MHMHIANMAICNFWLLIAGELREYKSYKQVWANNVLRNINSYLKKPFNSIQFKFICIALFTIQSLQSALQEIKFLQYIYTL